MTKIYEDKDLYDAMMQQRRILGVYFAVLAVFLGGFAGLLTFYLFLPYNSPDAVWVIVGTSALAALFIAFSFPYLAVSYKRCHAYVKMLRFISRGLKESMTAPFAGIDDWTTHDGVDVNVAVFNVPNRKREEEMVRQVFIDGEKDYPPFKEGASIKFVTQGNLLIEYEILDF